MFKFSMNWLKDYCEKEMTEEEIFKILNLQGFEFQGKEKIGNDIVTAIEVKANRPDMLCHRGIAREINAFKNKFIKEIEKSDIKINNENYDIKINSKDSVKRFSTLRIKNVNNNIKTPDYISNRLEALGVSRVNAIVDIINYVMFEFGQPMHCYDEEKLAGKKLIVDRAKNDFKLKTLNGEAEVKKGDILILDEKNVACIAGIVGAESSSVTENTKNIILEAAVFDEVSIRLSSRRLKITTPSSFRFERGVDIFHSFDILSHCAKMITSICQGEICSEAFDYYPNKKDLRKIDLSVTHTNNILGTNLKKEEILSYLTRYGFKCKILEEDKISVTVPGHRITSKEEIDLIGEVARIHGYDNIPSVMPTIKLNYLKNRVWDNKERLRNLLLNLNFSEVITYSFVPNDLNEQLGTERGDFSYSKIMLKNPISLAYSLMRPTLIYSLLNSLAYNYSIKNTDLAIFELGRTYFENNSFDTNCKEIETCGFIMTGVKSPKGWGQTKDINYDFYDLVSYFQTIMKNFGLKFDLKETNYKFLKQKTAYEIIVNGKQIGFLGQINKESFGFLKNLKLIKTDVFYCEIRVEDLEVKDKKLKFESKYPPVKRLYNIVHSKKVSSKEIEKTIKYTSEIIRKIEVKDVYIDKNIDSNKHAVLYEVTYCSKNSTLTCEEISEIENSFIKLINEKFQAHLKA